MIADPERWARVCAVLNAVFDAPQEDRQRVLAEHCAGDASLRQEVVSLLAGERTPEGWLDTPALEWAAGLLSEAPPQVPPASEGDSAGPFRLVRELARGGMGTVWLAERADGQFQQRVALKLLKRGLDSDAILGSFLQERRILARLEHPHIARLLDGGVTDDGRPYFAMELIDGEPISTWCDTRCLGVRDRLELFSDVAGAVQHAHQQLIVHRDLKPSNVLVTLTGEVKLLDFGIAKMLDAQEGRADSGTLTHLGWRLLTPEYAAPEQLRGDPVTTATDVYALGVLLYELLSGERPTCTAAIRPRVAASAPDTRPAPRASTRVCEQAARVRGSSVERLRRTLRGDLDTILLRALQPESERRYGSAQALSDDVARYLSGQPVLARPDSALYRARKFVARNRVGVAASILVALSLTGGVVSTGWQARTAQHQAVAAERQAQEAARQARRANEVKEFLTSVFKASDPSEWRGGETTARALLERGAQRVDEELVGDLELHTEMLATIGDLYVALGELDRAEPLLRRALVDARGRFGDNHSAHAASLYAWSGYLLQRGRLREAEEASARAVEIFRAHPDRRADMAQALARLAVVRDTLGQMTDGIRLRREALAIHRELYGSDHGAVVEGLHDLGLMLTATRRYAEAEPALQESLNIARRLYGNESAWVARLLNAYGRLFEERGDVRRAATAYSEAVALVRALGDDHLDLSNYLVNYGIQLCSLGQIHKAQGALEEALRVERRKNGGGYERLPPVLNALGMCWFKVGRFDLAEPLLRESATRLESSVGLNHDWTLTAKVNLGRLLVEQGRLDEAEGLVVTAFEAQRRRHGAASPRTASGLQTLGELRFERGAPREGLALVEEAVALVQEGFGSDHPRAAMAQLALTQLHLRQGRPRMAEAIARRAFSASEQALGPHAPTVLRAQTLLGASLAQQGLRTDADLLLRRARDAQSRLHGADSWQVAEVDIYLGTALGGSGREEEARALLEVAHDRLATSRGDSHWLTRFAATELTNSTRPIRAGNSEVLSEGATRPGSS